MNLYENAGRGPPTGRNRLGPDPNRTEPSRAELLTNEPKATLGRLRAEPGPPAEECGSVVQYDMAVRQPRPAPPRSGGPRHGPGMAPSEGPVASGGQRPARPAPRCPDKWFPTRSSAINLIVIDLRSGGSGGPSWGPAWPRRSPVAALGRPVCFPQPAPPRAVRTTPRRPGPRRSPFSGSGSAWPAPGRGRGPDLQTFIEPA